MFRLHWLNKLNWFENIPFDVWHNPQKLPQADHILGFKNLSADVSQNILQGLLWYCCSCNQMNMLLVSNQLIY
jgi:hypothetical protein